MILIWSRYKFIWVHVCLKFYQNRAWFDKVIAKIKWYSFFDSQCTFSLNFDLFSVIVIGIPNFIQIGQRTAELWRHIEFSRWRIWPWRRKYTASCGFSDGTGLRRSKFICIPNLDKIMSIHGSSYYYFRFIKSNSCHIVLIPPVYILQHYR